MQGRFSGCCASTPLVTKGVQAWELHATDYIGDFLFGVATQVIPKNVLRNIPFTNGNYYVWVSNGWRYIPKTQNQETKGRFTQGQNSAYKTSFGKEQSLRLFTNRSPVSYTHLTLPTNREV
eukprot:TRINITY_DN1631_c0_g1_i1.p1 TRINITY_DN1631_c0_g1~~TRINITY_DN1631_c0_g1_i1.p1  ORF type:complete len:121 (-),score=5.63 TRINITY_DN1631_c0_g1_i1:3-365(-)